MIDYIKQIINDALDREILILKGYIAELQATIDALEGLKKKTSTEASQIVFTVEKI